MVSAWAEVAFLGPTPGLIAGNLSLGRRLFCWIYRQRNPRLSRHRALQSHPDPVPRLTFPAHGAHSDANPTLAIGGQLWKLTPLGEHHPMAGMGGLEPELLVQASPKDAGNHACGS